MRQLLKSKRSSEMTIGTIIIIILALVVLIFLIYSFMKSGGSLMDNLKNFFSGGTNVDTIKNACQAACTTQASFSFCQEVRTLKVSDSVSYLGSCKTLSGLAVTGIASCAEITCDNVPKKCGDIETTATWSSTACGAAKDLTSKVGNSEENNIKEKPYCCGLVAKKCSGSTTTKQCSSFSTAADCAKFGCTFTDANKLCSGTIDCSKVALAECTSTGCQETTA